MPPPSPQHALAHVRVSLTSKHARAPAGHKDGHVRTWDVFSEQPQLLLCTPAVPPLAPDQVGLP